MAHRDSDTGWQAGRQAGGRAGGRAGRLGEQVAGWLTRTETDWSPRGTSRGGSAHTARRAAALIGGRQMASSGRRGGGAARQRTGARLGICSGGSDAKGARGAGSGRVAISWSRARINHGLISAVALQREVSLSTGSSARQFCASFESEFEFALGEGTRTVRLYCQDEG
ncbi:hypothetical protein AAFF_G00428050 [Aldrovandia affinis]|uniref:Uncharacterized protein n=1 Tax=Aldrovandia affinis TaxID=143900 RepID=A0AAD7WIT7_9TELE|nr:hypothetical protein AAFF_G00428050 [Aldrovandia affinis]